jgi:hypothetical protein
MAIVVIGGHSRSVGKTSVVAGLIAAMPERHWMAVKITQHGHELAAALGEICDGAADHSWTITEERERSGESDTSRFLAAGAERALWVRTPRRNLAQAVPALRKQMAAAENVIIESNSVMEVLRPNLYLMVLDYGTADFKPTARRYLHQASATILHDAPPGALPAWNGVSRELLREKPVFRVRPPQYVSPEMVAFVRAALRDSKRIKNSE